VGILSILICHDDYAWYGRGLAGHWRSTYVITAMIALYLNTSCWSFRRS